MFGEPQIASYFAASEPDAAPEAESSGGMSQRLKELQSMSADEVQQKIAATKKEERLAAEREAANEAARQAAIADGLTKAKAHFAAGRYREAELTFGRVLMENPDNRTEIVCNRAACSLKLEAYDDALSDAAEATAMDPTYVKAHYRLALAQQGLGKLDRAVKQRGQRKRLRRRSRNLGGRFQATTLSRAPASIITRNIR